MAGWRADWLAIHLPLLVGCAWLATEADWLAGFAPPTHEIQARWESPSDLLGLARAGESFPPSKKIKDFQKNHVLTGKTYGFCKLKVFYVL